MLEAVINVSEGIDTELIAEIGRAAGDALLDVHSDPWHNRSVYSLASDDVLAAALELTATALARLDFSRYLGTHPALGAVDVVPFTPIGADGLADPPRLSQALIARDLFSRTAAERFGLPCFCYGPERTLPELRRRAFVDLQPDQGPRRAAPRSGACCVGARGALVAYNLWLASSDVALAKSLAAKLRSPAVRALGMELDGHAQVSLNLVLPMAFGPAQAFDAVRSEAPVRRAELVGLLPHQVLQDVPRSRWQELDLSEERCLEARIKMPH